MSRLQPLPSPSPALPLRGLRATSGCARVLALALAFGLTAGVAGLAAGWAAGARVHDLSAPTSLAWLKAAPPPAGWKPLPAPKGRIVLWRPPDMAPVKGDPDSVSAALIHDGTYLAYLNTGPPSGGEKLSTWPSFRLAHLRGELNASVREDAHAFGLRFRGGQGACVVDDYVTHVKSHHYREIACFAQGRSSAGVIIAAALAGDWTRFGPVLERAVDTWQVR